MVHITVRAIEEEIDPIQNIDIMHVSPTSSRLLRAFQSISICFLLTCSKAIAFTIDDGPTSRRSVCQTAIVAITATAANGLYNPLPAAAATKVGATKPPPPLNFPRYHPGLTVGNAGAGKICEVFVDFTCPYSRKLFAVTSASDFFEPDYKNKMAFVYHNVVQPWHHQSLWLHESSFVVKMLYPNVEFAYWKALFEIAPQWYDEKIYSLTRAEFYDQISEFAAHVVVKEDGDENGADGDAKLALQKQTKERILQYLIPPMQPGGNFPMEASVSLGSSPTDDENAIFPYTKQVVKFQRKRGVHVTPTCFFNGMEQSQISSSWTTKEWDDFLVRALE